MSRHYRTPRALHRRDPGASNIAFSEIRFSTEGCKELYGWWIPVEGHENAPTLVLVHGWGRNVELLSLPGRGHSDCNRDSLFWQRVTVLLGQALR